MTTACIELEALHKSYGSGRRTPVVCALDGLNLSVPRGSLFGLLGPNGAGKTTTLRILCTLLAPDSGSVRVAGLDALADPRGVRKRPRAAAAAGRPVPPAPRSARSTHR